MLHVFRNGNWIILEVEIISLQGSLETLIEQMEQMETCHKSQRDFQEEVQKKKSK